MLYERPERRVGGMREGKIPFPDPNLKKNGPNLTIDSHSQRVVSPFS